MLKFPFKLTKDQIEAVETLIMNGYRGSIIYSSGTGKTEIACTYIIYSSGTGKTEIA